MQTTTISEAMSRTLHHNPCVPI